MKGHEDLHQVEAVESHRSQQMVDSAAGLFLHLLCYMELIRGRENTFSLVAPCLRACGAVGGGRDRQSDISCGSCLLLHGAKVMRVAAVQRIVHTHVYVIPDDLSRNGHPC